MLVRVQPSEQRTCGAIGRRRTFRQFFLEIRVLSRPHMVQWCNLADTVYSDYTFCGFEFHLNHLRRIGQIGKSLPPQGGNYGIVPRMRHTVTWRNLAYALRRERSPNGSGFKSPCYHLCAFSTKVRVLVLQTRDSGSIPLRRTTPLSYSWSVRYSEKVEVADRYRREAHGALA